MIWSIITCCTAACTNLGGFLTCRGRSQPEVHRDCGRADRQLCSALRKRVYTPVCCGSESRPEPWMRLFQTEEAHSHQVDVLVPSGRDRREDGGVGRGACSAPLYLSLDPFVVTRPAKP